jgi:hypothetical protein
VYRLCMGSLLLDYCFLQHCVRPERFHLHTRRKTKINDSINDSFFSRLGLKLPINDSNNVFGFESFSMSRLCHLSRLLTRG